MIRGLHPSALRALLGLLDDANTKEDDVIDEHVAMAVTDPTSFASMLEKEQGFTVIEMPPDSEVRFVHRGHERIELMPSDGEYHDHYAYGFRTREQWLKVIGHARSMTAFFTEKEKSGTSSTTHWVIFEVRHYPGTFIQFLFRDSQLFPDVFPKKK